MLLTAEKTELTLKAKLFRGFSDPSRLGILEVLRSGPLTVGEIVEATGLSQSNASNHLRCMRDCGLVVAEQSGRFVTYHISDDRVGDILALTESLLADVARGVYECTRYNVSQQKELVSSDMKPIRTIVWLVIFLISVTGCSLLQPPPTPSIPTPIPAPLPLEQQFTGNTNPVVDPVSALVPTIDSDIAFLANAVSRQNLIGYVQTLEGFGTRNTFSDTERDDFGIGAARRWIFNEFQRVGGGQLDVQFQDYFLDFEGLTTTQRNIVATLPGTGEQPGALVLMANYDTRVGGWLDGRSLSPGADDNASGVAALLEIARLMSSRTWDQTVIFVALTAEEQGTFGSRHFVREAFLNNTPINAAINNDMIGGRAGISQTVRLFSVGPDTSNARQLTRYIDYVGGLYLPTFPIEMIDGLDREDRWGDHREFVNAGYAAVRLIESEEDLSIQNSRRDTWSLIDYDYFAKIVQLNLVTLANMACVSPPVPPIVTPMADPGSFLITWSTNPMAAGYAISVRPVGTEQFPPFRFVSTAQAGNVVLSGFDSQTDYAISIAALKESGCLGLFSSPEINVEPTA